jgi:lipopolysaccharide export system permease protein
MIIYRYLTREILLTMLTVIGVVLVIAMGWRFSGYLRDAAGGNITQDILFLIMLYKLPVFLELIIPLSFFLGIMIAYGRLYVDSEMVVLEACGLSPARLIWITMLLAILIMAITACLSLWLKPIGEAKLELLFKSQRGLTEFDMLAPGRFQMLRSGRRVTYTEELDDKGDLANVFITELKNQDQAGPKDAIVVVASSGSQVVDKETGNRFLLLKDGSRYSGIPGKTSYQIVEYEGYGQLLAKETAAERKPGLTTIPTIELWQDPTPRNFAELQWRVSIFLLVPILGLMAVPLSRVNPRQGRFSRLAPGLALSFLYVLLLSAMRAAIEKGQLPVTLGLWWIHLVFLGFALLLFGKVDLSFRYLKASREDA